MEHLINAQPGDKIIINVPNWKYQPIIIPAKVADYGIKVNELINNVIEATGISLERLQSNSRKRILVSCRTYISYNCYTKFYLSYSEIGRIINRDHSTIIHQVSIYENFTKTNDKDFMDVYNCIEKHIANKTIPNE